MVIAETANRKRTLKFGPEDETGVRFLGIGRDPRGRREIRFAIVTQHETQKIAFRMERDGRFVLRN